MQMEDVQSWWEVPTVALFFDAFRKIFNLTYIEILDLETALLNLQDPEVGVSLEHLVSQVLQGFFEEDEVTSENWEEKMHGLFEEEFDAEENPLKSASVLFLEPREKIQTLMKLCQLRLDLEGAMDEIKDIPSERMQARCVGRDNKDNVYWYFCDERLYKEFPTKEPVPSLKKRKKTKSAKGPSNTNKKSSESQENAWSVACFTVSDWEVLARNFTKSRHDVEKQLAKEIKDNYLTSLIKTAEAKDRLLKKRLSELAPKRQSSRLSCAKAKKKIEEDRQALIAEERRRKREELEQRREINQRQQAADARNQRALARERIIEERLYRALQRERLRERNRLAQERLSNITSSSQEKASTHRPIYANPTGSALYKQRISRLRNATLFCKTPLVYKRSTPIGQHTKALIKHPLITYSRTGGTPPTTHSRVGVAPLTSKDVSKNAEDDKNNEFEEKRSMMQKLGCFIRTSNNKPKDSSSPGVEAQEKASNAQSMFDKWKSSFDARESKVTVLQYTPSSSPNIKKIKLDNVAVRKGGSFNDFKTTYLLKNSTQPLQQQSLNSFRTSSSPTVIKLNFIKPPTTNHQFKSLNT